VGAETSIAWTDHTFNPWWGCRRVSPGCENCYAEAWDARWSTIFTKGGDKKAEHWGNGPRRFFGQAHWSEPRRWNKSAAARGVRERVFCASMADVFESRADLSKWRIKLWTLIEQTPFLDWQLLTKRPENLILLPEAWIRDPRPNVWIGTSVEDQERADKRIPLLLQTPAAVRFLSVEPMLDAVDLRGALPQEDEGDLEGRITHRGREGVDWIIIGGESGGGARPMRLEWMASIAQQCKAAGVACFTKQWGSRPIGDDGQLIKLRDHKGGDPHEWSGDWPREFPETTP